MKRIFQKDNLAFFLLLLYILNCLGRNHTQNENKKKLDIYQQQLFDKTGQNKGKIDILVVQQISLRDETHNSRRIQWHICIS